MATLHMPFWAISLYTGIWAFSGKWCEFQAAIAATLVIASILNMGLTAFNRHIRVVKPALYSKLFPNKRMARFYCAVVWITAILFGTLPLYGWGKTSYHPLLVVCTFDWKINHISYAIVIVGIMINGTTSFLVFYSYCTIYDSQRKHSKSRCP